MKFLFNQTCRILQRIEVPSILQRTFTFYHKHFFKKEFSVPTFCNVTIDVPFRVNLEPLDVHKYSNCDKIIVELNNFNDEEIPEPLDFVQKDNNIYIKDTLPKELNCEDLSCTVIAPIKANLNILTKYGDIKIKHFNGDKIIVSSETGNILVNGYQGKEINVQTSRGTVEFEGVIQSFSINISILECGSVMVNKLLGDNANITTKSGDILVNSSYCNKSRFVVEQGDMYLKNMHKYCEVVNEKSGNINISSLDGQLNLIQENGNADIHLSRVTENSKINLVKGHLVLRLSEECQETTNFNIKGKSINIKGNVTVKQVQPDAEMDELKLVQLNCVHGSLDIEAGSWFNMKFPKNSDFS